MQIEVLEIHPNIFNISLFETGKLLSFNHFLIRDEKPTLIHTGHQKSFEIVSKEIGKLIDIKTLSYICFSHFEPDECGSLNEWFSLAPNSMACINRICDSSLKDFTDRPSKILRDGDKLSLGKHELLFLETPHFPHNWEACFYYETKTKTLFSSDLGSQRGFPQETKNGVDLEEIMDFQSKYGFVAFGPKCHEALQKLNGLEIETMATMHGVALDKIQTKELLARLDNENKKAWSKTYST